MGAGTGNQNNRDAAQQQQAMEGQAMRRRALEQQAQSSPNQEEEAPLGMPTPQPSMGRGPELRSGIEFGPGRASRVPDQGTPEYEQLLQRVRGLGQGQR